MITGAKDTPLVIYTPSQAETGKRKRRKKFTPTASTGPATP
jgi:hypothetical protein